MKKKIENILCNLPGICLTKKKQQRDECGTCSCIPGLIEKIPGILK